MRSPYYQGTSSPIRRTSHPLRANLHGHGVARVPVSAHGDARSGPRLSAELRGQRGNSAQNMDYGQQKGTALVIKFLKIADYPPHGWTRDRDSVTA
jgi:hypothetical protein